MQIEQQVNFADQRLDLAGALQLDAVALAVQCVGAPDAVHVLVDEAGRGRLVRVEARIGGDIAEDQGQLAARGAEFLAQQQVERSEEHTSELQSLMRISYAVFCLQTKNKKLYRLGTNK